MVNKKSDGSGRTRSYATVVYPESAPDNWLSLLEEVKVPCCVSPLHCDDFNPDGEPKKAHYHVLLLFESVKSESQAREIFDSFGGVGCEKVNSVRGYARYLTHLDNPEKSQYSPSDVQCFFGADYYELISLDSDRYGLINDMCDFITANHIHYFNRFFDYCRLNNDVWFRQLCSNSAWIVKEYIKSLAYDDNNTLQ